MKILLALVIPFLSAQAHAETLRCASKKNETLYYTEGQLLLTATVAGDSELRNVRLSLQPEGKLGAQEGQATGKTSGGWTRFSAGGDAWCSYRLALPASFARDSGKFVGFVDASCEENSRYSVRVYCSRE